MTSVSLCQTGYLTRVYPTSCSVVAGIGSMPHVTLLRISEWMDEWESASLLLPGICHRIEK